MRLHRTASALLAASLLAAPGGAQEPDASEAKVFVARVMPGVKEETLEYLATVARPAAVKVETERDLGALLEEHYGARFPRLEALARSQNPTIGADGKVPAGTELIVPAGPRWDPAPTIRLAPGELLSNPLELFHGRAGPRTVERVISANALESDRNIHPNDELKLGVRRVELRSFELRPEYVNQAEAVLERLRGDTSVEVFDYARPSEIPRPDSQGACTGREATWPFDATNLVNVLARNKRVSGRPLQKALVVVADSGIDENEARLLLWENPREAGFLEDVDDDLCGYKDDVIGTDLVVDGRFAAYPAAVGTDLGFRDHGTHVAGLVQGGVSEGCLFEQLEERLELMILKITQQDVIGNAENLAVNDGALANVPSFARFHDAHVVNLSVENAKAIGTALADGIKLSTQTLFVVAAGNGEEEAGKRVGKKMGPDTGYQVSPANLGGRDGKAHVITVAAHDGNEERASFSNFGEAFVDLAAPGCRVPSLATGKRTASYDGTSMAAGLVSMTAALLHSEGVTHPIEIGNRLLAAVDPVPSLKGEVYAQGVLNPVKALAIYDDWVELEDEKLLLGKIAWPSEVIIGDVRLSPAAIRKIVPQHVGGAGLRARVAYAPYLPGEHGKVHYAEGPISPGHLKVTTAWGTEEVSLERVVDVVPRLMRGAEPGEAERFDVARLNEPSGLSRTSLSAPGGVRLLAVDDDDRLLYVVETRCGELSHRTIEFSEIQPNDLEALAYDGARYHYAITSHRRLGNGREVRRAVRFELSEADLDSRYVGGGSPLPEGDVRDLSGKLAEYLPSQGIPLDIQRWKERRDASQDPHPYELELEGAAFREGKLLLGVRWPLDADGRALVLEYDWEKDDFVALHRVDLLGHGISGMDFYEGVLLLATNPPGKERNAADESVLGQSKLCGIPWPAGSAEPGAPDCVDARLQGAKLEGVVATPDRAWLAYDGGKPSNPGRPGRSRLSFLLRRSTKVW